MVFITVYGHAFFDGNVGYRSPSFMASGKHAAQIKCKAEIQKPFVFA